MDDQHQSLRTSSFKIIKMLLKLKRLLCQRQKDFCPVLRLSETPNYETIKDKKVLMDLVNKASS